MSEVHGEYAAAAAAAIGNNFTVPTFAKHQMKRNIKLTTNSISICVH
jgi:hypothetical protein